MENQSPPAAAAGPEEATAALHLVDRTRADLADRLVTPVWYHPVLGLIEAAFVVSLDLPRPGNVVLLVLGLAGLAALVRAYARVTGLGIGGDYLRLAGGWVVGLVVLVLGAMAAVLLFDPLWVTAVAATAAFVATVVFGRRADPTIRARLRAGVRRPSR